MIRLTAISATLVVVAASSASAMQAELQSGGLIIGESTKKPSSVDLSVGVQSKYIDNGYLVLDDSVATAAATVRFYGLGVHLDGAAALGRDIQPVTKGIEPMVAASRKVNPGETVALNATLDYLVDINGVYADNEPFFQLRPYLTYVTYPNQQANVLKDEQTWAGVDAWLATPIKGIEVGVDNAWNLRNPAYRGGGGLREIYQRENFDIQLWQLLNWGNRINRSLYQGYQADTADYRRGLTTSQIGGKVTSPLPYREWWFYAKADWTYWLLQDDREYQQDVLGRDGGNLSIGIGIEWIPERTF